MLEIFEKLINEHGSSVILRERLELYSDKYSMLEEKNKHLQTKINDLESKLSEATSEVNRLTKIINANEQPKGALKLSEKETQIINYMFENNSEYRIEQLAKIIGTDVNTAKYHINGLNENKLVHMILTMSSPAKYKINDKGIKYVVESKNT